MQQKKKNINVLCLQPKTFRSELVNISNKGFTGNALCIQWSSPCFHSLLLYPTEERKVWKIWGWINDYLFIYFCCQQSLNYSSTFIWLRKKYNPNKKSLLKSVNGPFLWKEMKASLETRNAPWNSPTALLMSSSKYTLGTHCSCIASLFSSWQLTPGSLHWFHGRTHKIRMLANGCASKLWQGTAN